MYNSGQDKFERKILMIIAAVVVVAALFLSLISFISNFLWFGEMGYLDVFFKQLVTQLTVGVPTFVVITLLVLLYLTHLRKSYFKRIASAEQTDMKALKKATLIMAVLFGGVSTAFAVTQLWFEILKFANSTGFDIADPLFNIDISFYIFKLEFLKRLNELMIGVIVGIIALTVVYYMILMTVRTPDMFKEEPQTSEAPGSDSQETGEARYSGSANPFENAQREAEDLFSKFLGIKIKRSAPKPKKQIDDDNFRSLMAIASGKLSAMGFVFFLMLAVDFFLKQFELLHVHTGIVYGAGFTDVTVTLWMLRILCAMSVITAFTFVVNMKKKAYKKLFVLPALMIIIGVIGYGGASLVQNFIVSPDEINKESKYLEKNIEYTQYAYGLDDVTVKSFPVDNTLTSDDIANNMETITNIRINDFEPVEQFYNQTQSIRQYYTFNDVDNDRYWVNGEYTQTFLTAREIDESKISDTWLNKHLKYTHGYGIAMSRVDKVTSSGQPDVLIGNIPPESSVEEIQVKRPEIYFGELANEYVVVGTDEKEFDYPAGDSNAYTTYEGTAGIKMNLFNRLVFSIREGSLKLLVSSNINSDSKIIINRNVVKRVMTIMPYLSYENDPYMVISEGRLFWILDAYTTSSLYPYSEPYSEESSINYIRNSVKVVVDAYNGNTDFYVVDEKDPIAMTYSKIYPTLFKSLDKMPEGIKAHIRYANTLFEIQANVYSKYHMEDVNVFYQSEDLWDIANEIYGTEKIKITPNYYIAKLPGESKAEFFNSVPFTPKSKQNMTALMVARNDGENYGELVLYQFPKSKTIYGTEQIEAQIDQNTEISKEFTLWNSSGTKYRRGNLFVIPINTSILYVEPVYLEAQNSSIPEVKRIIVAYKDRIAYGETLKDCIIDLFGYDITENKSVADPETPETVSNGSASERTLEELITAAQNAFNKSQSSLKAGNWAEYGEQLKELENYLNKLAAMSESANNIPTLTEVIDSNPEGELITEYDAQDGATDTDAAEPDSAE